MRTVIRKWTADMVSPDLPQQEFRRYRAGSVGLLRGGLIFSAEQEGKYRPRPKAAASRRSAGFAVD